MHQAYFSAEDSFGLTAVLCLFEREFRGKFAGRYRVAAFHGSFCFPNVAGVVDDFGRLVPVEV